MIATTSRCGTLAFVGAAIVGAFATSASAQITLTDPALRIEASNSSGSGFIDFSLDPGAWNPDGSYFWFLMGGPMQIMDGPNVIATVTAASVSAGNLPYKTMGIGFTVFAGDSDTSFTATSALSSFVSQVPGEARATGGITLTDSAGTAGGASLTGDRPGGTFYSALMNGVSPGTGTTFADLITGPFSVGNNASNFWNDESAPSPNFTPTGPISSLTTVWAFTLSAGDQAATSSGFFAIPAPATFLVLGGGALAMRRRR